MRQASEAGRVLQGCRGSALGGVGRVLRMSQVERFEWRRGSALDGAEPVPGVKQSGLLPLKRSGCLVETERGHE